MKNILYMSLVDWFWIKQRPQHISEILSKNNKVTYVSIIGWKSNKNVVITHSKKDDNIKKYDFKLNYNMEIKRKRLIPKGDKYKLIKNFNNMIMRNFLERLDQRNNYDVIILTHPLQYNMLPKKFFNKKVFIYDCMDNYKCWPNCDKNKLIYYEKRIVNISKYIIASSKDLYNELMKYNPKLREKLHIVNNGVDIENFKISKIIKENEVNIFRENNRKKVGYIGTISGWVDLDLIKNVALKNRNIEFYIIGPIDKEVCIKKYSEIENIIFTGSQPYYTVPNILNKLDVCIMPFIKMDLVKSVNPVKIYEYLAMGKPVLALRYEETEKFGDLIYTYDSEEEFERLLKKVFLENSNNELVHKKIQFARENSWVERAEQIEKLIMQ